MSSWIEAPLHNRKIMVLSEKSQLFLGGGVVKKVYVCTNIPTVDLTYLMFSMNSIDGRGRGLVVCKLDSGSRGLGSTPGQVIVLCS